VISLLFWITAATAGDWRLVAAYDASTVATVAPEEPRFVWRPVDEMSTSCGPAKSPDGLGMFEAETVANGLAPTLALVLERTVDEGESASLSTDDVRVSIGGKSTDGHERRVLLHPMVEPRHLAIEIKAPSGTERFGQLVRTQLEVETCLEHKVGRGWTGQDAVRLRQAFMLTPPRTMLASRKYFGGERDPVPALLGPPDACVLGPEDTTRATIGRGEGSLTLVPTDVWGAALRACDVTALTGAVIPSTDRLLPLALTGAGAAETRTARWEHLEVSLSSDAPEPTESQVHVTLRYGDSCLFDGSLFRPGEKAALEDLLAKVPQHYPVLHSDHAHRVVLMIPNWQIVEALRQIQAPDPDAEADLPPAGVADAVGFLLANPEHLFVQVRPTSRPADGTCPAPDAADEDAVLEQAEVWSNLAGVMRSGTLGQPWGYTVGLLAGRSPIVLPRASAPTWAQTLAAQRGTEQAALLICLCVVFGVIGIGARRVPDLWARIPVERAFYWPGVAKFVPPEAEVGAPPQEEG
jgi:hypothetical protein